MNGKIIMAIDPGHIESAYAIWDGKWLEGFGKIPSGKLLAMLREPSPCYLLAVERIACMGMAVGEEVFETVRYEARFVMAWLEKYEHRHHLLVPRMRVKMHHCGDSRAKDANIRQALIDRFGPGKEVAIGRKASPGPLYGVAGDVWSALAIATATWDVCEAHGWNLDAVRGLWLKTK